MASITALSPAALPVRVTLGLAEGTGGQGKTDAAPSISGTEITRPCSSHSFASNASDNYGGSHVRIWLSVSADASFVCSVYESSVKPRLVNANRFDIDVGSVDASLK